VAAVPWGATGALQRLQQVRGWTGLDAE
jgi:hypothetical protein